MTAASADPDTAFRVADRLRARNLAGPWDVFGERIRKYEIHLSAGRIELVRGPVAVEGYGLRVLRPKDGGLSEGFQASTDLSAEGVGQATADAEANGRFSRVPAPSVELPSQAPSDPRVEISDPALWQDAPGALQRHVAELLRAVQGERGISVTFGSVKVMLTEMTLANSSGLSAGYTHTTVQSEIGILASGGDTGAAPGEYWVTDSGRRLETDALEENVRAWARYAQDTRRARQPPTGKIPVILPAEVLAGILPGALDFMCTGEGKLYEIAPAHDAVVGPDFLTVADDGRVPWAVGSTPFDDEGISRPRRHLLRNGKTDELACDLTYGSAIGQSSTGNGLRVTYFGPPSWNRFTHAPRPSFTTLSISGGAGGSDEELVESARDGIWVQQLGWASPNSATGTFGGEIRIGYRIRNGKLAEPVRGGTVGGLAMSASDEPSLFRNLVAVGGRPELRMGVQVPALLTQGLTVSGESSGSSTP